MTPGNFEQRLSDLVGFQCALVALRGAGPEASEEMVWQTLLAALVEQYGLRRAWYARCSGGELRPAVVIPTSSADLPAGIEQSADLAARADFELPVAVEGRPEGRLFLEDGHGVAEERAEQIRILVNEAAIMVGERRSRLRTEDALREARREAEAANWAKSMLLANMSHEIRTPMNAVLGFTDLLSNTALTPEQRDYVDTVRSSGQALLTLINDILDFSKIEAGKLQLEAVPIDVRAIAQRAAGLLAVQASEKKLRLSCQFSPSIPPRVQGDAIRLQQILVNLLGNAVKFTASGEVELSISSTCREDGHCTIEFRVRDTGPGIPLDIQKRLFQSYSQADASISRKFGGTGLGLSISHSLAQQMGGSMWVESEPGRGSTFHFTIAALIADESAGPPAVRSAPRELRMVGSHTLRVIVADDNAVNRELALIMLRRLGYLADSAADGAQLLDRLGKMHYDVVLMDMQMPEMDGIEAARHIRRDMPPERQPRIIAMTAAAFPEDRERCLEAGMDDYVSKPIGADALAQALLRAEPALARS
jgi:signal transduction histidine kinase/CheY-like chemotaxis protein